MKHELAKNGGLFWGYFERVEDFPTDKELKQGDFLMLYKKEIVKKEIYWVHYWCVYDEGKWKIGVPEYAIEPLKKKESE